MKTNAGFIKVPRAVLALSFWDNAGDVALWLYCALRVSHCQYGSLKAGQYRSTKKRISQDLHWSRNTLNEHLDRLQAKGFISIQLYNSGLRVTLNHWEKMACCGADDADLLNGLFTDTDCSISDTDDAQFLTGDIQFLTPAVQKLTAERSKIDTIQEHIQEQDKTLSLMSDRERAFERWWQAYPRHENKADAKLAFMALDVPADRLMAALAAAKTSRQWLSSNGRFIPNAARWLDGTWQDFLPADTSKEREENPVWTTY